MNVLNIIIMINKLTAIINLKFSHIFTQLKKYFNLIEYFYQYIKNYVTIFKSFQLKRLI